MFLISVTKNRIKERCHCADCKVHQVKINSDFATIVTDNFLSQLTIEEDGFKVVESPLVGIPIINQDMILAEIIFNKAKKLLSVFKPTISGRPIYYHLNSRGEFYCSTHIAMLKKAGVVIEENADVLPEFFLYRCVTPPKTLYKNINQLPVGSKLNIGVLNGQCVVKSENKYNPFNFDPKTSKSVSIDESVEQIYANLVKSISSRSPCQNRLSVMLSGGMDSSIIFAACKNIFGINKSYSTVYPFENITDDIERKYALSAAGAFGSDHLLYETNNTQYLYGFLESMVVAEEPLHHLQSVMLYLLFKNGLPQGEDIIVSGEGADSAFGLTLHNNIYKWNNHKSIYRLLSMEPLFSLIKTVPEIIGRGRGVIGRINLGDVIDKQLSDPQNIIYSSEKYGNSDWVCDYFNVREKDIIENKYKSIQGFKDYSIYDVLAMLTIVGSASLTSSIWSKLGEGCGKILYYPFYDKELLNNAFSIKWECKLKQPKNILRGVARKLSVPNFIIERPKSGFACNPSKWSKKDGVFDPLIPLASKCFDKKIIMNFQSSEMENAMTFWNILNYAIWKRLCIDNEPLDVLQEELSRSIADSKY